MKEESQNRAIAEAIGQKYHKPTEAEMASGSYYQYEPNFTRNLNAAAEFAKYLTKLGWNCSLENGLDTTWECTFYKPARNDTHLDNIGNRDGLSTEEHYGAGDTMAVAICAAGLRAIGKWVED